MSDSNCSEHISFLTLEEANEYDNVNLYHIMYKDLYVIINV